MLKAMYILFFMYRWPYMHLVYSGGRILNILQIQQDLKQNSRLLSFITEGAEDARAL